MPRLYLFLGIFVVALAVIDAFLIFQPFLLKPSIEHILSFPHKQDITVSKPITNTVELTTLAAGTTQSILFKTSDEPKVVLSFYRDLLLSDGWTTSTSNQIPSSGTLYFYLPQRPIFIKTSQNYYLSVYAQRKNSSITEVEINLREDSPNGY